MTIHWSLFVPGMLLLIYPADRLLSALVELRSFDCFQNLENNRRYRPWWWVPALWLDPLRGFLGTLLVQRALEITTATWALKPNPEYALLVGLVALGVLCQTFTRRGDAGVLLAPIGFVAGVVIALTPLPVALLGIVSATLGLFAFRQFHAFFAFGLVAVCLLGLVLGAGTMWIGPAVGAFALPIGRHGGYSTQPRDVQATTRFSPCRIPGRIVPVTSDFAVVAQLDRATVF